MRRVTQGDDEQGMVFDQSGNHSAFKDRFRQDKKKGARPLWLTVVSSIVIYSIVLYFLISLFSTSVEDKQVASLQHEIDSIKLEEKKVLAQIGELQKEVTALKQHPLPQSQSQPQPAKIVQVQPSKPISTSPAPLTVKTEGKSTNNRDYMTPELKRISQKRTQKTGYKPVAQGTVQELKLLMKNEKGQTIDEVIYKDPQTRKKRVEFQNQRINFIKEKTQFQSLNLVKYNMKYDESYSEEQKRVEAAEYERIRGIHFLDEIKEEIPMCLVVPGYNNNAKFRIEYNLNSIFLQNYTNYFAVIINDASNDGSDEIYRKYFDFYKIDPQKYVYIENSERLTALENIYMATHYYCSEDSVVINMDADDEFIGKNPLKMFNAGYQKYKAGVLYSNFFWYEQGGNLMLGFTSEYTQSERETNAYRQASQRFSHLRSYRTELFRRIAAKDFQDDQGKFYRSAYDMAMYFPLMELSCGRIKKINGFHYLYNINTGLNDYQVDRNRQASVDSRVRGATKYTCYQQFDKRMKS